MIELLYFNGCPSWRQAEQRLREALHQLGSDAEVTLVEVTTDEQAQRLGFRGSPTVLVGGVDPFASAEETVGFSCRVYRTPDGLRGAPTVKQLTAALS